MHRKRNGIINCYSSTSEADDDKIDAFHCKLEEAVRKNIHFYNFVTGHSNGKIGRGIEGITVMKKQGSGERHEN